MPLWYETILHFALRIPHTEEITAMKRMIGKTVTLYGISRQARKQS
jgi:hypothetical protein